MSADDGSGLEIDAFGLPEPRVDTKTVHARVRPVMLHWQDLRTHGRLPRRRDIDPLAIWPCLADMMILDVIDDGADFRYALIGENPRDIFGVTYIGRPFKSLHFENIDTLYQEYLSVVKSGRPLYIERRAISERDFVKVSVAKLILPLGEDDHVDHLLICLAVIG